ncbi:hypothetical protein G4P69_23035 [Aetokthonos hydrillicola CCALA 1050]|nr:hypothetical protein [Aetokthonos hydrillicola CCALA 1050]
MIRQDKSILHGFWKIVVWVERISVTQQMPISVGLPCGKPPEASTSLNPTYLKLWQADC